MGISSSRLVMTVSSASSLKSLGSRNPHNMVKATFAALQRCASPRSVANRRGKKVAEIFGPRREAAPAAEAEAPANG